MEGQQAKRKFIQNSMHHQIDVMKMKNPQMDQVTAHCKLDHMTPQSSEITEFKKNKSCYLSSFSPPEPSQKLDFKALQKGLQHFRKHDSNSIMLPNIIVNDSQYSNSYKIRNIQAQPRSKQRPSFFMKLNWALKPISEYDNKFIERDGSKVNKQNNKRINHDSIEIFECKNGNQRISNYTQNYKVMKIVKEPMMSEKNKDHLFGSEVKQIQTGISEYKKRYDSMMFDIKQQKQTVSIYRKDSLKKAKQL